MRRDDNIQKYTILTFGILEKITAEDPCALPTLVVWCVHLTASRGPPCTSVVSQATHTSKPVSFKKVVYFNNEVTVLTITKYKKYTTQKEN